MIESQSVISYATESEELKCVVGWVLLRDLFYMVKKKKKKFKKVEENVSSNNFCQMICVCLYERTADVRCFNL